MKNKLLIIYFILGLNTALFAQDNRLFSFQFNQILLEDAIVQIEKKSQLKFYYAPVWLDSIDVDTSFTNQSLDNIIAGLLSKTRLYHIIFQKSVILSQDQPIVDDFAALKSSENNNAFQVFSREKNLVNDDTQEEIPVEIGNKALMVPGKDVSLAGYVREQKNGEPIVGALVYIENPFRAVNTNAFGFYSLTLPSGLLEIKTQYAGMQSISQRILLYTDGKLDLDLEEDVISLKEVIVESDRDINVSGTQMGLERIDVKNMKNIPKILGENDLIQVTLTLPGVQSIGEGASGFNVRGGNSDQNLILLNDAPIFNTSHFLGFFSVFNADVIKKTELYKSSIPARYGSRLASTLEIQMKDGNQKEFSGSGGIGPVTGRLSLEMPIVKDQTSLILGGRTTYSDWVLNLIPDEELKNSQASFFDAVARVNHQLNENNSLSLTVYGSQDKFRLSSDSLFSYRNLTSSLQWRHTFNNKFFGILTGAYSQYDYEVDFQGVPVDAFELGFKIQELDTRLDFSFYQGKNQRYDFGIVSKYYRLEPGFINSLGNESLVNRKEIEREQGLETAIYFSDQIDIGSQFSLNLGLRYSWFGALGPGQGFRFQENSPREVSSILDTTNYSNNQLIQSYHGPEWRIAARYSFNAESSLKLSYNRTRQYIHQLSNTISVSPTDTWKLSDEHIQPQIADQVSMGFYKNFLGNTIETSLEVYYKRLDNLLDYKVGSDLILNDNLATDVLQGRGKAYGFEVLLRKKNGKFNGWLSYTFSRTLLKFDSPFTVERINQGSFFPANYDKPHSINLITNFRLTQRYSFSANFTYSTGRPITFPVGNFQLSGGNIILFSDRNQFRIPDYYRLDLGINIEGNHKIKKLAHSFWSISVYNVLGRKNPYSVFFIIEDGEVQGRQLSVFGAPIPTITYNFSF